MAEGQGACLECTAQQFGVAERGVADIAPDRGIALGDYPLGQRLFLPEQKFAVIQLAVVVQIDEYPPATCPIAVGVVDQHRLAPLDRFAAGQGQVRRQHIAGADQLLVADKLLGGRHADSRQQSEDAERGEQFDKGEAVNVTVHGVRALSAGYPAILVGSVPVVSVPAPMVAPARVFSTAGL